MPGFEKEWLDLNQYLYFLTKSIDDPYSRLALANGFAAIHKTSRPKGDPKVVGELVRNGISLLGEVLSNDQVNDITKHIASCKLFDREKQTYAQAEETGAFFTLQTRPQEAFVASMSFEDLIRCPHLLDIAIDPKILSNVGDYLGCPATISTFVSWYSFPGNGEIPAEHFHRDRDDLRFVKLFVYLSDVDEGGGPHQYLPQSHHPDIFAQYLAQRNIDIDVMQLFKGNMRQLNDTFYMRVFEKDMMTICAPRGTCFLEDTYGLHRGFRPATSSRLLFQVLYTTFPTKFASKTDRSEGFYRKMDPSSLNYDALSPLQKYALRFFVN